MQAEAPSRVYGLYSTIRIHTKLFIGGKHEAAIPLKKLFLHASS
jgi:hypothetical protein